MRDRLSIHHGLVLLDCRRVIVPAGAHQTVLESLHAGHQGSSRTFDHAASFLHWPHMQRDIEDMCVSCQACAPHAPAGWGEPLLGDVASSALEVVGTSLFEYDGRVYMVAVDAFTSYPHVRRFTKMPTSRQMIEMLLEFFAEFGLPTVIRPDRGRQYESAEFRDFCHKNRTAPPLIGALPAVGTAWRSRRSRGSKTSCVASPRKALALMPTCTFASSAGS